MAIRVYWNTSERSPRMKSTLYETGTASRKDDGSLSIIDSSDGFINVVAEYAPGGWKRWERVRKEENK